MTELIIIITILTIIYFVYDSDKDTDTLYPTVAYYGSVLITVCLYQIGFIS